jgi:hypothetical protein
MAGSETSELIGKNTFTEVSADAESRPNINSVTYRIEGPATTDRRGVAILPYVLGEIAEYPTASPPRTVMILESNVQYKGAGDGEYTPDLADKSPRYADRVHWVHSDDVILPRIASTQILGELATVAFGVDYITRLAGDTPLNERA